MNKNSERHRVLQVIPHATYSGVETSAKEIAANLKNTGYDVVALSESRELESYFEKLGIKHYYLNIHSSNPFIILKNAFTILGIIKKEQIDIVHARSRAPAWSCAIAAHLSKKFFITTFHSIYNNSGFLRRYYNSIMVRGKKIVAISAFVKEYIIKNYNINPARVVLIYRGIDTTYFNKNNVEEELTESFKAKYHVSDSPVILLSGDFSRWKGHLLLLKALAKIKDLKFHCLFVGDLVKNPLYTEEVRNQIINLKLQSKVRIFSTEIDKRSLYSISDIVISNSQAPEAFNKSMIKAQSMEKIAIATNIGSSPEIIVDNITGFLLETSDVEKLAGKLRFIIENIDSDQMNTMRIDARKSAIKNFGIAHMINQTSKLYDTILKK